MEPTAEGGSIRARLDRIDRLQAAIVAELAELRAEVASLLPEDDGAGDLAEHNLISVQAAAERWCMPADSLRHRLRHDPDLGVKRGNVWSVSVPRLVRRLKRW